jgi:hypothetical protein
VFWASRLFATVRVPVLYTAPPVLGTSAAYPSDRLPTSATPSRMSVPLLMTDPPPAAVPPVRVSPQIVTWASQSRVMCRDPDAATVSLSAPGLSMTRGPLPIHASHLVHGSDDPDSAGSK